MGKRHLCMGLALLMQAATLPAEIAVSANDGKALSIDAPNEPRTADSIAVLDLRGATVRILATLTVPGGPTSVPGTVAVTPNSRLAIVTVGQIIHGAGKPVPADIVSVVDISRPSVPRLVQTLHAGAGAAGVAINPAGTLALIANMGADSLSVFRIAKGQVSPVETIALEPKSRPVDVAFADNGRAAYVVAQGTNQLLRFSIENGRVTRTGAAVAMAAGPYSLALDPRRQRAYVSHLGGRAPSTAPGPKPGSVAVVDLKTGHIVDQVDTGVTPEHVGLSPSGRYLQVTVNNGSALTASSPAFHDYGLMTIYRVDGAMMKPVAETRTGRWCQGAVWSADEKRVLLQCSYRKQIEVYRFDGRSLTAGDSMTLDARPGAIATARSR
jgi:6-phosphogluconolactonase (cycloisomerase 2 family)